MGRQSQQQVLFKGGSGAVGKKTVPSPLSEHAHVAKGVVSTGKAPPSNGRGIIMTT